MKGNNVEYNFIYGADISSLMTLEARGVTFKDANNQVNDLFIILKDAGFKSIRLRLWVNPQSIDGEAYEGGNNDLEVTIALAKRAYSHGFKIVLDFHYSDFWADPGKQFMPKAWEALSFSELVRIMYMYTASVLQRFTEAKIPLHYVQVGNEITNGILWPHGKLFAKNALITGGYERLSALLNSGIKAVREFSPQSKIIIHLDRGGDVNLYKEFLSAMYPLLSPFDIIGLSYYPYWHGTFSDLQANITYLQSNYVEDIMIMETSYAYNGKQSDEPYVVSDEKTPVPARFPPFTPDGQKMFMHMLLTFAAENALAGIFYWEPAWLVAPGDTWASKAGREYIEETHKADGNEWGNQALFTKDGTPLPALYTFKHIKKE